MRMAVTLLSCHVGLLWGVDEKMTDVYRSGVEYVFCRVGSNVGGRMLPSVYTLAYVVVWVLSSSHALMISSWNVHLNLGWSYMVARLIVCRGRSSCGMAAALHVTCVVV